MVDDRDEDDATLFRDSIGPVRRLRETAPPPAPAKPKPRARMAERDEANARDEFRHALDRGNGLLEAADPLAYRRDSLSPRIYQRLRRAEIAVQDELDLHGADARQAEILLREFVTDAHYRGIGCIRVIHGKGSHGGGPFGTDGMPVLKNLVDRLLRQRADVLAFHSPPPNQGGTGAVLVLLAPPRRRR